MKLHDLQQSASIIRSRHYGVILTSGGRLVGIHLRRLPKLISWPEIWPIPWRYHAQGPADYCYLYYNQPRRFPTFLTLKYIVSTPGTSYATFLAALTALDNLAELKGSDALLCDVANTRISDRLLTRMGWEPHNPRRWHRHYIKRFYGTYPSLPQKRGASPFLGQAGQDGESLGGQAVL